MQNTTDVFWASRTYRKLFRHVRTPWAASRPSPRDLTFSISFFFEDGELTKDIITRLGCTVVVQIEGTNNPCSKNQATYDPTYVPTHILNYNTHMFYPLTYMDETPTEPAWSHKTSMDMRIRHHQLNLSALYSARHFHHDACCFGCWIQGHALIGLMLPIEDNFGMKSQSSMNCPWHIFACR